MSQKTRQLTIGMPHMVPGQLSEVELIKHTGDLQWQRIGEALDMPPHELVNDAGERLYASFINVDAFFGDGCLAQFKEGDCLHMAGRSAFYSKQFIEGWALIGKDQQAVLDADAATTTKADLDASSCPRIYMTNALVARVSGNTLLRTFRPAGIHDRDIQEVRSTPAGLVEHERVQKTGILLPGAGAGTARQLCPVLPGPEPYEIQPDTDLNGAGLLYFARYIAMMNHAERRFLLRRLTAPFSTRLSEFLSTRSRQTYYFANADPSDTIDVHCTGWLLDDQPLRSVETTTLATFAFEFQLYRRSDGVLMASSRAERCLIVPNRFKALHSEAARFLSTVPSP